MKTSRRQFMKVGGMAGLLAFLAPASLLKEKEEEVKELKFDKQNTLTHHDEDLDNILSMKLPKHERYRNVGGIESVAVNPTQRDIISSVKGYREFISSFHESGITACIWYSRRGFDMLNAGFLDSEERDFKIDIKADDKTEFMFKGYVTSINTITENHRPMMLEVEIKVPDSITATMV